MLKGEKGKSKKSLEWDKETSFQNIKESIVQITSRGQTDFRKPSILTTDASNIPIGAVLAQKEENGHEKLIYAFSKRLDETQMNYSTTDMELLAIVKSIERFRHYLLGKFLILRTDHRALEYLWSTQNTNGRLLRWALKLQEYDFMPTYIKGEHNIADGFSRPPYIMVRNLQKIEIKEPSRSQCERILSNYHLKTGHGGVNTMEYLIKKRYEWTGIHKDIAEYVCNCKICRMSGGELVNRPNKPIKVEGPNQLWIVDLIGRLETKN